MALELSQTSCVDLIGDFHNNSNAGREQEHPHNAIGHGNRRTAHEINLSQENHNGNLSHRIDTKEDEKTMPDCITQSQDFQPSHSDPNTNSQVTDSEGNTSTSSQPSTNSSTTSPIIVASGASLPGASEAANMNTSTHESSPAPVGAMDTNNSNKDTSACSVCVSNVEETEGFSVEVEHVEKEDGLVDIIIPVPVLPRTPSPVNNTDVESSKGHGVVTGNQQQVKKRALVRRPTPVRIETPTKLLNKLKMESSSFAEEEEEEEDDE